MRKWVRKKEEDSLQLIIVPESYWETIMRAFHDDETACHAGIEVCLARCRQIFYWAGMKEEFTEYIKGCIRCNQIKQPRRFLKAPLQQLHFHHFNDAIIIDHIVPESMKKTPRGFRYILGISDAWSNYLVAVPVRTTTAKETIAVLFKHWINRFGVFREVISDRAPGFRSQIYNAVFKKFDADTTYGTAYKASSTGRAEMNNKRINNAIRSIIPPGRENTWDLYVDRVAFALNCMQNSRNGFSAHKMTFGREANVPLSLLVQDGDEHKPSPVDSGSQEAYALHKEMRTIIRKVRKHSEAHFMYAKRAHEKNVLGPYFKVGDLCFLLINCPTHKFSHRYRGPFEIAKVINDHLYVVKIAPGVERVVNLSKLKQYTPSKYNRSRDAEVPATCG